MQDASSYDQVFYPNRPQRITHPRHLEAVATLFGMTPQPSPQSTVLELGSATGANLIAQAYDLHESKFLGIDFSEPQIADGQKMVETLGLDNIELRHADIMDVEPTWGQFDYIICPGVYSWTPREVQDKIMDICQTNLAPNGVAFVSYNVYPGWHLRTTIREMMLYHVSHIKDQQDQIDQARTILEFLAASCQEDDAHAPMIRNVLESVRGLNDAFFFHEYLEATNTPIYFHEFADRAQANGLQYLGEADVSLMFSTSLPQQAHATLEAMHNLPLIRRKQYMDFARNRAFRATLLCHQDITLQRQLKPAILQNFNLNTTAHFEETDVDINGTDEVDFSIGEGKLRTGRPLIKAAFSYLNEKWPRAVTLQELHTAALDRLSPDHRSAEAVSSDLLGMGMMAALVGGMLELSVHPPRFVDNVSDQPVASALAREQAADGEVVTNMRQGFIQLDTLARYVIRHLDGRHDRDQLVHSVKAALESGALTIGRSEGQPDTIDVEALAPLVDHTLEQICKSALLIA